MNMNRENVWFILTKELNMIKVCTKMVLKNLSTEQTQEESTLLIQLVPSTEPNW
jgi:hypothetical protein